MADDNTIDIRDNTPAPAPAPAPQVQMQPDASPLSDMTQAAPQMPQFKQSRLGAILSAVAGVSATPDHAPTKGDIIGGIADKLGAGLAGIPDKGRPSFITGLGQGARSAQEFKFRSLEDAHRAAQLTMQDRELHLREQEQEDLHQQRMDAHTQAFDAHQQWLEDHGYESEEIPNDSTAVKDRMRAQSANGGITVPAGTSIHPNGKTIVIPKDTPGTHAAQVADYNKFGAGMFGLPTTSDAPGRKVSPQLFSQYNHLMHGFNPDGSLMSEAETKARLDNLKTQRELNKDTDKDSLDVMDKTINLYQKQYDKLKGTRQANEQEAEATKNKNYQTETPIVAAREGAIEEAKVNAQQTAPVPFTDSLGVQGTRPAGGFKEGNKRVSEFKKDADKLSQTEGTYDQFQSVLNDINAGKDITGAQSVIALFNAIGISAEPLQGKGFRINASTIDEHRLARSMGESAARKFTAAAKNGEIITPQQIKDYANIATQARHDAYINKVNEARGMGLDPIFLMPRGNGRQMDSNTIAIFLDAANGNKDNAMRVAQSLGWK
jgi:hypothetical protein